MEQETFDMVVIGAGAAGLVTAAGCARLGVKTALIEKSRFGGECLWNGCVPSKALVRAAGLHRAFQTADRWGLAPRKDPADFKRVLERMRAVMARIEPHDSPKRFQGLGVETISGQARFAAKDRVVVEGRSLRSRRFAIATGADPAVPAIVGLSESGFRTFEDFFDLERQPGRLLVVGGGPVGCEMAQVFQRLGTQVTLVQSRDRLLPKDEPELTARLAAALREEGVRVELSARPERIERAASGVKAACRRADGSAFEVEADELLLAVGKRPRVTGLYLDLAGVAWSEKGVEVDEHMRTSNPRVFACGDVTGLHLFTHMAEYQAGLVVMNALAPFPVRRADYAVVPWVTYTDPELAHVGMTEAEAAREFGAEEVRTYRYETASNDRHVIDGEAPGLVKLVTDLGGRVLGAGILSAHAGELIHEYALAVKQRCRVHDLSGLIHAYPTLSQANKRVADVGMAERYLTGWLPKAVAAWARLTRPR